MTPHENQTNQPTNAKIGYIEVVPEGFLIKAIYLCNEDGDFIRDAKLLGTMIPTLTEQLIPLIVCK